MPPDPVTAPASSSAPAAPAKARSLGDILQEFSQHRRLMQEELQKIIVGQNDVIEQIFAAIFTRGHCLLVGVPGLAKTLMVSTAGANSGHQLQTHSVHARPDALGHHRHERAGRRRKRPAEFPLRRRADLHEHPAGRRNQPHAAQDPGGLAAGDAGARSHGRPDDLHAAGAVLHRSPRKTRSSRKAPIRCPKRSSTASCSTSRSTIRPPRKKSRF